MTGKELTEEFLLNQLKTKTPYQISEEFDTPYQRITHAIRKYGITYTNSRTRSYLLSKEEVEEVIKLYPISLHSYETQAESVKLTPYRWKTLLKLYNLYPLETEEEFKVRTYTQLQKGFKDKYGVDNPMKLKDFKDKPKRMTGTLASIAIKLGVSVYDWKVLLGEDFVTFKINKTEASRRIGVSAYSVHNTFKECPDYIEHISSKPYQDLIAKDKWISRLEKVLQKEFSHLNAGKFRLPDQSEIDLYFHDMKIGFEFNGYHYHTSLYSPEGVKDTKPTTYHKRKTDAATKAGIKLYHFWYLCADDNTIERAISFVKQKIGLSSTLHARKCSVSIEKFSTELREFYNNNHIQGHPKHTSNLHVILRYNNEIVSAQSFSVTDKQTINERYCVKQGLSITGGFNKLMKHAAPHLKYPLITYCDRDITPFPFESVYYRYGFELAGLSGMHMRYYDSTTKKIYHRQHFQKHKLSEIMGAEFDPSLTEHENLANIGIYPLYNSGVYKYVLNNKHG